jgi:uncharacterized glyoxalase superfamily protein PhnB
MTDAAANDRAANDVAARSVASEVTVSVSPQAAFTAFTADMDLWWVRGPINFFDAARAVEMVCEPGVGGRILEVYDRDTGEALELGKITAWQPGERVAWRSSVDDVTVEVSFAAAGAAGTLVRVVATIPAGGRDKGGSFWQRVVPAWFGSWFERRAATAQGPEELDRLAVAVYYERPVAAAHWLADAFGLVPAGTLPSPDAEGQRAWIEFRIGRCSVLIFSGDTEQGGTRSGLTHVPWIYVDDLDAHFARAQKAGATIVEPIYQHGFRAYMAEDPEGRRWTFAQARPTMR